MPPRCPRSIRPPSGRCIESLRFGSNFHVPVRSGACFEPVDFATCAVPVAPGVTVVSAAPAAPASATLVINPSPNTIRRIILSLLR
jgi:hypothetical protein